MPITLSGDYVGCGPTNDQILAISDIKRSFLSYQSNQINLNYLHSQDLLFLFNTNSTIHIMLNLVKLTTFFCVNTKVRVYNK